MLRKAAFLAILLGAAFAVLILTSQKADFVREDSLEMGYPPASVWSVLMRAQEWPRWWPGIEAVSLAGELHEGRQIELSLKGNPGRRPATVVTFVPHSELAWEREGVLGSVTRTRLRLDPAPEGTSVVLESRVVGPQAVLAEYASRDDFALYHEAVLRSLEMYLESGSHAR